MFSRFCVVTCYLYFILFNGQIIYHCMCRYSFNTPCSSIRPSIGGHLCCWYCLALVNDATVNICTHIFVWTWVFVSLGYILRSRISGSCGNLMFNHWKTCQTVFQSNCLLLRFHQLCFHLVLL